MVVASPLRVLSLCSGIGGLDEGVRLAFPSRVVGYCERDAFAASVLLARMEDSSLEPAPVWCGDFRDLDGFEFRGRVDTIVAGLPCQPFSQCGSGVGLEDPRHLWPDAFRIIQETDVSLLFLENVSRALKVWLPVVLEDLAALGFNAEWGCVQATPAGSPQRRERLFVVAHRDYTGRGLLGFEVFERRSGGSSRYVPDGRGGQAPALAPAWPPGPTDQAGWDVSDCPKPSVCRSAPGISDRMDRLRALGNAVVPQQAALAFQTLTG